jgi:hypothetical protein
MKKKHRKKGKGKRGDLRGERERAPMKKVRKWK